MLVAARSAGLGQLRGYLVADLLSRYSERTGLTPTVIDLLPRRASRDKHPELPPVPGVDVVVPKPQHPATLAGRRDGSDPARPVQVAAARPSDRPVAGQAECYLPPVGAEREEP